MPTIKVRRLTYDNNEIFRTLGDFISLNNIGEIVIHDNDLCKAFDNARTNYNYIQKLEAKIQDLEKNITDSTGLNTKNWDLKKQIQEKDKEIYNLQDKIKGFESEIQPLQDKNNTLNNTIKELENNLESLKGEHEKLSKDIQKEEDIKAIFNKWGTYQSLQKDVDIVRFFMSYPDTDVRQKTVIETFKHSMDKTTVRKHLYGLVKKKILQEPDFKGTYRFNSFNLDMSRDMDRLAELILGNGLFEMAVKQRNKKLED